MKAEMESENIDHRAAMNYMDLVDSSKPAEYHEPSGFVVSENKFRAADDRANLKRKEPPDFLKALWWPDHMRKPEPEADRDEGILVERPAVSLPWNSARQVCLERYTDNMAANNNNSGRLNQAVERTELVNAWSDIVAARLAKEQALQQRNEALSDMARAELLKRQAREQLRHASAEKAYAEHARVLAKRQIELAEVEFASAKQIQEQAHAQLAKARLLKEQATRRIDATRLEITCQACRRQFQYQVPSSPSTTSWGDQYDNSNPNLLVMSHNFQRGSAAADQNQNNILKKEA